MISGAGHRGGLFVAGTDTGVGKTLVAAGVIRLALDQGLRVHGLKPVETGCKESTDGLFPEDGAFLVKAAGGSTSLQDCTPFRFSLPASPYRAATQEGRHITISSLEEHVLKMACTVDCIIVDGEASADDRPGGQACVPCAAGGENCYRNAEPHPAQCRGAQAQGDRNGRHSSLLRLCGTGPRGKIYPRRPGCLYERDPGLCPSTYGRADPGRSEKNREGIGNYRH